MVLSEAKADELARMLAIPPAAATEVLRKSRRVVSVSVEDLDDAFPDMVFPCFSVEVKLRRRLRAIHSSARGGF
jgi:hypothetical protein